MTCYGVEFLDLEWYYAEPPAPEPRPEPWRHHPLAGACLLFARDVLMAMAQGPRLALISRDGEYLDRLRASLVAEGLKVPLELVIDREGRIVLKDGHHRLLVTEGVEGFETFPARLTRSDTGIAVTCATVFDILSELLRTTSVP